MIIWIIMLKMKRNTTPSWTWQILRCIIKNDEKDFLLFICAYFKRWISHDCILYDSFFIYTEINYSIVVDNSARGVQ